MENNTFKETTIIDYIPILQEHFPYLSKKDIKNIIQYGWKLIYSSNCYGCDTLVTSQKYKFWFYIGGLCNDPIKHFTYYKKRLMRKLQFLYIRNKPEWDGYYYVGLSEEEASYFLNPPKRGRKKVKFEFKNKWIFKSKDICSLFYSFQPCIIKFKYVTDVGLKHLVYDLHINSPEVVTLNNIKNFKDVLVSNNDYDLL